MLLKLVLLSFFQNLFGFFQGCFLISRGSFGIFPGCLPDVLDVDQSSLFIVGEPPHTV
jgi:hypothetical protein